jgi:excisionase family DNA binding protein
MEYLNEIKRPSKEEQMTAIHSYNALASAIEELKTAYPEIEIEETKEKIKIPLEALKLFAEILKAMSQGNPISIVPIATEMTTQSAAEFLGCSRPHLVKMLENGEIPFTKVGRHRRVKFDDVRKYKEDMKKLQEDAIIRMMKLDEDLGLYDS